MKWGINQVNLKSLKKTKTFYFHQSIAHHKNEQSRLEKAVIIYNNVNEFCTLKPAKTIFPGSIHLMKHMRSGCVSYTGCSFSAEQLSQDVPVHLW
jgi:hypothetical protein